ncbi:MAG: peptidoglycan-associated lipoprotein Pal [Pseudomonadaceae bacterium]|nr:peptidoglycan-associated lipoprotein Pal [Pseudomonadaceae bacterium]
MTIQWIRTAIFGLTASLLLAACGGNAPEPQTPATEPEVADTTPVAPRAPEPEPPAFSPNGDPYVPGTTRLLNRTFYFAYDSSVLSPDDLAMLEVHATVLRENPSRSVVIEGHCDERGTREYNLALGERRGNSVRSFLVSAGVPASRIETVSYGEERPEDPGHSESAYQRNRRAIVQYR